MSSYRKRFVQFNMLLIGIVLTVMVSAVAIYMVNDYYSGLRVTMEQVVAPLRGFSQPDRKEPPDEKDDAKPSVRDKNIITVFYSPDEGTYSVLSSNNTFSDEEMQSLLKTIVSGESDFGVLRQSHVIYYRSGTAPYRIAITSTDYITNSVISLCLVLIAIWAGAMLLFLLISIKLSALAARPLDEAMQREKQFVADASHDLKTPLSVILANNSIIRENPEAAIGSVQRWLDSTHDAAKHMQQLISQMLTLADAERPDAVIKKEPVDISGLAMKAALEMESVAYEKNIILDTELPDTCMVNGDHDRLLRIISSLLKNALKYEPCGGHVLIRLVREKRKADLYVRNFGSTISRADLPHVFDRFYRSDKSRKSESGSFGLGLAITKELVEKSGGKINVTSSPEDGTVFHVTFI